MKYFIFIAVVITLFFNSCGSSARVVVAKVEKIPSWYKNPRASNEVELYALGEGRDKKEAISNALSFMLSTLSVSISSNYNAKTIVKEGLVNSSEGIYTDEISSEVKKIRISNYKVVQSKSLGFKRYAVLVSSNKQKLFDSMKQEIHQKFKIINQKILLLNNSNSLKQLSFYKEANHSLKNMPNTLIVMNVLDSSFRSDVYLKEIQKIRKLYQDKLEDISFSVETSKNALNIGLVISKGLSDKKLKINKTKDKNHFNIYIKVNIEKSNAYGFILARSEMSLVTTNYLGTVIGSNSINITGQSSQGFEVAKQNLAYKLSILIKKDGIAKVLGLSI